MTEQIIAEIVLRASDGSSIADAKTPITPKTAKRYKIDEKVKRQAREKLIAYGFQIEADGPFSLSISGGKEAFEQIFQVQLRALSKPGIVARKTTFYVPLSPIKIPEDLASCVAAVTLPAPPDLFP